MCLHECFCVNESGRVFKIKVPFKRANYLKCRNQRPTKSYETTPHTLTSTHTHTLTSTHTHTHPHTHTLRCACPRRHVCKWHRYLMRGPTVRRRNPRERVCLAPCAQPGLNDRGRKQHTP